VFAIGFIAAFLVAAWVVKALVRFVSTHGFTVFAWYRIAFGLFILISAWTGLINWG
ncbi:undecaprenyl-diphosphate phosphatase, partial [Acinetobacter baumannii]